MTPALVPDKSFSPLACWNWKCALMSAVVRSMVYAIAMMHGTMMVGALRNGLAVIAVEMVYVVFTAGLWAGLQQVALGARHRRFGDLMIVVGVPGLSQLADLLLHLAVGAPMPQRALVSVCVFTLLSALFHRHVMRHGTFLTGERSGSLVEDFRRMPRLVLSFLMWPGKLLAQLPERFGRGSGIKVAV